jgi:hypothetical protein
MKGTIRILLACLTGIMLLAGGLWLLNPTQAAGWGSLSPFSSLGAIEPKYILVDDFKDGNLKNHLGGEGSCWAANGGFISCTVRVVGNDGFLEMAYNVVTPTAFALYSSPLISLNLTALDTAWVAVKGHKGSEPIYIEFKDCDSHYPKELISDYLAQGIITSEWSAVAIPLAAFSDEITDWTCIDRVNIMAHNIIASGEGKIYVDDIRLLPAQVLVDDFHDAEPENELGGASGFWEAETGHIDYYYTNGTLELDYDVTETTPIAEASYWTELRYTNLLTQKDALFFKVQGDQGSEGIEVEFKDCGLSGQVHYPKIKVSDYLVDGITTAWRGVAMPLAAFADGMDWGCVDQINFHMSAYPWFNSGQGTVFVDDVIVAPAPHPVPLMVDHFNDCNQWNAWVSPWVGGTSGTATMDSGPDPDHRYSNSGCGYRIAYDVDGSSSAWVYSGLRGINVTDYTHLRFFLKGAAGGEALHVYLGDSNGHQRYYADVVATNDWQEILIPLSYFSPPVALTSLSEIKIAFEWRPMNGEVYLDDISFMKPQTFLPIVLKNYQAPPVDRLPSCSPPYNNYEPNNFRWSTTFTLSSGVPIQSYICAPDDIDDYYYIDVTHLNPITARLTNIPRGMDYDLYLYYGDSLVAGSNKYGNADEELHYTPTQIGRYYIRVYPYSGHSLNPYTLWASFQ